MHPKQDCTELLAQHVLAGLRRLDRPFGMQAVRRGQVDRLGIAVGEQCFVAAVMAAMTMLNWMACRDSR